jgi:hypothetical protein
MSIIWFLIPSSPILFEIVFIFQLFVGNFSCLSTFHLLYFLFVGEGSFDGGYVFDDLGEHTYEDSDDWDKLRSNFGPSGIQRMTIQLLRQLDGIELHSKWRARRQERQKRPMLFPV